MGVGRTARTGDMVRFHDEDGWNVFDTPACMWNRRTFPAPRGALGLVVDESATMASCVVRVLLPDGRIGWIFAAGCVRVR